MPHPLGGVAATIFLVGVARTAKWAPENPVVAEVQAWVTTAQYAPLAVAEMALTRFVVYCFSFRWFK